MIIQENLTLEEKLRILADAAKYDVACTSSGVDRKGEKGTLGSAVSCGICHSFAADGRCISLLKVLLSNECVYDCKYCLNRVSNDVPRATFTPEELCRLTIGFYRRNYIEGLFLSSGILGTPDHTMEQFLQTLHMLRYQYRFNGYIHVKVIPGSDPELIRRIGYLTDRMSTNLEISSREGLKQLAPHKTHARILGPIRQVQNGIIRDRLEGRHMDVVPVLDKRTSLAGGRPTDSRTSVTVTDTDTDNRNHMTGRLQQDEPDHTTDSGSDHGHIPDAFHLDSTGIPAGHSSDNTKLPPGYQSNHIDLPPDRTALNQYDPYWQYLIRSAPSVRRDSPRFVPAGQSTQMIVGAIPETDFQLVHTAEALYQEYDLKRVFYSAYIPINEDSSLPPLDTSPPLLREHRLYQADWLLRFYGFRAGELLSREKPNFNLFIDPKCDWAIRHLEQFPVELTTAPYADLLRVPGIGVKSAKRILAARRRCMLDFPDLKKMGVVLKRAHYFITLNGRMMYPVKIDETFITHNLIQSEQNKNWQIAQDMTYQQLSLFDDFQLMNTGEILSQH